VVDAGADRQAPPESLVDTSPRRLTLLPLDSKGQPAGKPQRLTGERSHVLAYDLASWGSGVLVAWRDDPTTLGVEAQVVHVARVAADGTVHTQALEDPGYGAGAPLVLSNPSDSAKQPWLGVMGADHRLKLGVVDAAGPVAPPQTVKGAPPLVEPLARRGPALLSAAPRGRAVDLSVATCQRY
jgi:hypothetical protein